MSVGFGSIGGSLRGASSVVGGAAGYGAFGLMAASFGVNFLALALPIFILQVYDRVLPQQAYTTLGVLIAGLALALLLDVSLRALRSFLATWLGARFEHTVRCRAVESLVRAPLTVFEKKGPGAYLEQINAIGAMRDLYGSQLLLALVDLPFALLFLGLIAYVGSWLVLAPTILLLLFAGFALLVGRSLRVSVTERTATDKRRYDFLIETLQGFQTVKAFALNRVMLGRAEALQEPVARAFRRVAYQSSVASTLGTLFAQLNLVVLMSLGALQVLDGELSAGALAACTLLSGRALQPLQSAMSLWTTLQTVSVAQAGLHEIMTMPDEREGRLETPDIGSDMSLDKVSFQFAPDSPYVLRHVSLSIKPGEIIGIEGEPGAGKSTLLLLLAGVLTATAGVVRTGDADVATIHPDWMRGHVSLLPKQGVAFAGTVIDNLTNFREGEVVADALYLAYLLGLDDPIKRLPAGFDTMVGAGETLPAGLRQRIAIVRELVKQPKVVLLDEADYALDADATARLIGLLRQLSPTCAIVLVSSKPNVMQIANHRYRLGGGRLVPLDPSTGRARMSEAPV